MQAPIVTDWSIALDMLAGIGVLALLAWLAVGVLGFILVRL